MSTATPTPRQISEACRRAELCVRVLEGIPTKTLERIAAKPNDHRRWWALGYAADHEAAKLERVDPKAAAFARNEERKATADPPAPPLEEERP